MADSQMERRLSEMGIRRAFGASRRRLMWRLINENLLFTLLGGLFGLLVSYGIVYFFRRWIIHLVMTQQFLGEMPPGSDALPVPALINYTVFGIALLVCLTLNLMVTLIPAWQASRRPIVYSLNN
jgi:putative ABC transport system permease protein